MWLLFEADNNCIEKNIGRFAKKNDFVLKKKKNENKSTTVTWGE